MDPQTEFKTCDYDVKNLESILNILDSNKKYSEFCEIITNIMNPEEYLNYQFAIKTFDNKTAIVYYCVGSIFVKTTGPHYILKNSLTKQWIVTEKLPEVYSKIVFDKFSPENHIILNHILDEFEKCNTIEEIKSKFSNIYKYSPNSDYNLFFTLAMCKFRPIVVEMFIDQTKYDILFAINKCAIGYFYNKKGIMIDYLCDICNETSNSLNKCAACYKYYCPSSGIQIQKYSIFKTIINKLFKK